MSLYFASYNFIIIILLNICSAQKYYQFYKIQDYEICVRKSITETPYKKLKELFNPPEISLNYKRPISIKQIWNSTIMRNINSDCKFRVKAKSKKFGIYAVITKLKFRKNKITDKCLDYIEFLYDKKKPITPKLCGYHDANESNNTISFDIDNDDVLIKVFIDNEEIEEPLELELYLTAYSSCSSSPDILPFPCNISISNSCIHREFKNDTIPNCLQCNDEYSCMVNENIKYENIKHKSAESLNVDYKHIALSAITSLIFTMFAVGTIAYTIWKYWHFCHPVRNEDTAVNETPTLELPETQFTDTVTMNYLNQNRPPSPKDLPPSYEDLFPER